MARDHFGCLLKMRPRWTRANIAMGHLSLALLGSFAVTLDGTPQTQFGTSKTRALLAYLVVESAQPQSRGKLAALLWPELDDRKAAHNLSQTLLRLRRALGDSAESPRLIITPQTIQFNPHSDHQLDVVLFTRLIKARRQHHHNPQERCATCMAWLGQAAELYRGDFLADFFLKDSVTFEEWRLFTQERLHNQMVRALGELVTFHMSQEAWEQSQTLARRLLLLEPWQEQAQRQLMEALARLGRSAAAVEQYEAYTQRLLHELGLRPSADLQALHQRIVAGKFTPAAPSAIRLARDEKRQVTALICHRRPADCHNSPEQLIAQRRLCEQTCDPILARFGGQRTARQGNHCLVYFGFPTAYEDSAQRAVQTGMALAATQQAGESVVQIGIHTGMAVVYSQSGELLGDVPEVARHCQESADPGTVIISDTTAQLVRDSVELRALGTDAHYQVVNLNIPHRRFTPLIGRAIEQATLCHAVSDVQRGQGQAVIVQGTAGIGKSRLVWELLNATSLRWIESECSPLTQNTQRHPLVALVAQLLNFTETDSASAKRAMLDATLDEFAMQQSAYPLSLFLGILDDATEPASVSAEQVEQMRLAFVALLQKFAAVQPLGIVIEDLHWSDPSTLRWLDRSLDALTTAPCLLILTQRPNAGVIWSPQQRMMQLDVPPLTSAETLQMAHAIVGSTLPDDVRQQIVAQSDGVPLFIEEVASGAEYGHIPPTLRDSLTARLQQLGSARETAQWAATLGREFSLPLLSAVTQFDRQRIADDVAKMTAIDLVHPNRNLYRFKHALVQQAAYQALLKADYQRQQQRIAETLVADFADSVATQPERVAHHFAEAGMGAQSADYFIRAAERATKQGALEEAAALFERALGVMPPEDARRRWNAIFGRTHLHDLRGDRSAQRADLATLLTLANQLNDDLLRAKTTLGRVRLASRLDDFAKMAEEAERAIVLARRAESADLTLWALTLQLQALTSCGRWDAAQAAADAAMQAANATSDSARRAVAMGDIAYYYVESGDLQRAAELFTAGMAGAQKSNDRRKAYLFGNNLGFTYAQLGLFDDAVAVLTASQANAEALGDRRLVAHHVNHLGFVAWRMGERARGRQLFTQALDTFIAINDKFGRAACNAYLGMMGCEDGDWANASQLLRDAGELFAALGADALLAQVRSADAVCRLALGDAAAARQLADAAWQQITQHGTGGMDLSGVVYGYLADVLNSADVLAAGYREIMARAAKINNPIWRRAFLENEVGNRKIVARHAAL